MEEKPRNTRMAVREFAEGIESVARGESHLAKAEAGEELKKITRLLPSLVVALVFAGGAGLAGTLFLVFGIGALFDNRTWLGALLVSVAFVIGAVIFAVFTVSRLRTVHWALPRTRESLRREGIVLLNEWRNSRESEVSGDTEEKRAKRIP